MNRLLLCYLLFLLAYIAQSRPEIPYTAARKLQLNGAAARGKENHPNIKVNPEGLDAKPKIKQYRMDDSKPGETPSFFYKPECQRNLNNGECNNAKEKGVPYKFNPESHTEEINSDFQLPHCPEETDRSSIVVLATMEGDLVGLEEKTGNSMWNFRLDSSKPELISSSRTQIFVSKRDAWFDVVASLDGQLFLFDGTNYEAMNLNSKNLLHTSHRMSPETMLTGGSNRYVAGIVPETGRVLYTCNNGVCHRFPQTPTPWTLVLSRQTTTVNAIDPQSGESRWNMTIGEPKVEIAGGVCLSSVHDNKNRFTFKFSGSEGVVKAYNSDSKIQWTKKMSSAIAHAWLVTLGSVSQLDVTSDSSENAVGHPLKDDKGDDMTSSVQNSVIEAGMFKGVRYLTKSPNVPGFPRFVNEALLTGFPLSLPVELLGIEHTTDRPNVPLKNDNANSSSWMSTLMAPFSFSEGFNPLHASLSALLVCCTAVYFMGKKSGQPVKLEKGYLNLFKFLFKYLGINGFEEVAKEFTLDSEETSEKPPVSIRELPVAPVERVRLISRNSECFESRVTQEFNCIKLLGQGGFAAVFQMEHKTDLNQYAVKRIPPAKRYSQDRVLREARAMAQLSHPHIVRYYNCWEEKCTDEWIENYDRDNNVELTELDDTSYNDTDVNENDIDEENSYSGYQMEQSSDIQYSKKISSHSIQLSQAGSIRGSDFTDSLANTESNSSSRRPSKNVIDMTKEESSVSLKERLNKRKEDSLYDDESSSESQSGNLSEEDSDINFSWEYSRKSENRTDNSDEDSSESDDFSSQLQYTKSTSKEDSLSIAFEDSSSGIHVTRHISKEDSFSIAFEDSSSGSQLTKKTLKEESSSIVFEDSPKKRNHRSLLSEIVPEEDEDASSDGRLHLNSNIEASTRDESPVSNQKVVQGEKTTVKTYVYIQLELCKQDTLDDYLKKNPERDVKEIKSLFNNIVCAVEFIHDKKFIHRDLKPKNILFSADGKIKVGDFGLVTDPDNASNHPPSQNMGLVRHRTKGCGTYSYMAPEMNVCKNYDHKVDIFSLGIILIEMLYHFETSNERADVFGKARKGTLFPQFRDNFPEESKLIMEMLDVDPSRRPTTRGIRASVPFRDFQSADDLAKITEKDKYILEYQQ